MIKNNPPQKRIKYHFFRPNDLLSMQNDFIFFDTETYKTEKNDNYTHKLKLGWALYWNRKKQIKEWQYFKDSKTFWDFVENYFNGAYSDPKDFLIDKENKVKKELLIYAHNMDFDFKIVDGIKELVKREWKLQKFYIKGNVFSITYNKNKDIIRLYDTMNYTPFKLEKIGESLRQKKIKINFNKVSNEKLSIYCKNDVEIIYLLIKNLVDFLNKYELSRLKPTASSLALNVFRHKFYNYDKYPIFIHVNQGAIKLEREAYHGAITDCFKIGKYNEPQIKLDINSMYPYQMFKYDFPTKLIYYSINSEENLINILNKYIKTKHIIAKCIIELPEKYAYILTKIKKDKCGFLYGKFEVSISTPEIEFVLKYGKILKVNEIAIYDKAPIFKEYIDFFYNRRCEFKDINPPNEIFEQFSKLIMNGLYGKFGAHGSDYEVIKETVEYDLGKAYDMLEETTGEVKEFLLIHIGNKIVRIERNDKNSYDSFVAIAALVTAYARMHLVDLILKVGRENLFYADTDSLIIKASALKNIKQYCDDRKLGFLKIEGKSNKTEYLRPKWYLFNDKIICKGVKKIVDPKDYEDEDDKIKYAKILENNPNELVIKQYQWERFKTAIKNKNINCQKIKPIIKHLSKKYDKGIVLKDGSVIPFKAVT